MLAFGAMTVSVLNAAAALLSPRGRATRRIYWTYAVAEAALWFAVAIAIDWFDLDLFDRENRTLAVAAIVAIAVSLAVGALVGIKRLHDSDRSGWYLIFCVLPVIGWAAAIAMLNAPGTPGPNRFGPAV